jgi:hypothetical protein
MSGVMARLKMPLAGVVAGIVSSAYLFWPLIQEMYVDLPFRPVSVCVRRHFPRFAHVYRTRPLLSRSRYVKQQKATGAPLDMEAIDFMKQFGVPEKKAVDAAEANKESTSLLPKRRDSIE